MNIPRHGRLQSTKVPSRRLVLKLAAGALAVAGSGSERAAWAQAFSSSVPPLRELPRMDGEILFGEGERKEFGADYGGHVTRSPIAILKPRSVDDVVRMVSYANQHSIKIAMRGRGHSQYGQSQVEQGIVIDFQQLERTAMAWKRRH